MHKIRSLAREALFVDFKRESPFYDGNGAVGLLTVWLRGCFSGIVWRKVIELGKIGPFWGK